MTTQKATKAQRVKARLKSAAVSTGGKAGGFAAVFLAALIGGAKLVNTLTSEHTVANHVTDDILCVLQVDPSKCAENPSAQLKVAEDGG